MDASEIEDLVKRRHRAIRKGNLRGVIEIVNELGFVYTNLGRYEEALDEYRESLDFCTRLNDLMGQATAHRYIGEVLSRTNSYQEALNHHRQYLELALKCKSQVEEQRAYTTLGNTHLDFASTKFKDLKGRAALKKAEEAFTLALNLSEKVKAVVSMEEYAQMRARLFMNLALVYELYPEEELCINYFHQSIKISKEHSLIEDLYRSLYNLSHYHKKSGKFKEALDKCVQAYECSVKMKDDKLEMEILILKARILLGMSDFKQAKESLILIYKKKYCHKADEYAEAEKMLKKVFKLLNLIEDLESISKKDAKTLHPLYEKAGDKAVTLESYEFALCAYKNMEKCAKALGMKGKQLCPVYFSIWKTLKDLRRYPECLSYLEKEEKLELDNHKRLFKILLEKAEIHELSKFNPENIIEVYHSAYQQAKLLNSNDKQVYVLTKLLPWQHKANMLNDAMSTKTLLESLVNKKVEEMSSPHLSDDDDDDEDKDDFDSDDNFELDKEIDLCSDNELEEKTIQKNPKVNILGETPLHRACIEGNLRKVKALLAKNHPVNVRDNCGWLPLHEATSNGFLEISEILLDHGASINDRGGDQCQGFTPLHDACTNAHVDIIELLVRRGADLLSKNDVGELPVDTLANWCRDSKEGTPDDVQRCLKMLGEATERQKASLLMSFSSQCVPSSKHNPSPHTSTFKKACRSPVSPRSPTNENNNVEDIECISSPEVSQKVKKKVVTKIKAAKEYKEVMAKSRRPFSGTVTNLKQPDKPKTALVKETEFVGLDDWLVDDFSVDSECLVEDVKSLKRHEKTESLKTVAKRKSPIDDDRKDKCITKKIREGNKSFGSSEIEGFVKKHSTQECKPVAKWIRVNVGDKSLGIPYCERNNKETISWLAEEAATRYYTMFGRRPRLSISVGGMILMPDDPMEGLCLDGNEVVGSIIDWVDILVEVRYEDACQNFKSTVDASIKKILVDSEQSGFFNLSDKLLQLSNLKPVFHVLQSLTSLTQLHLKGNRLRNEGFQALVDIFKYLPYLSVVDLSSNQLTHESIATLSQHLENQNASEKRPLQSLEMLLLANNQLLDISSAHLFNCLDNLPSLKHLNISSCNLSGKFFTDVESAAKSFKDSLISYLDLGGNNNLKRLDPKVLLKCLNFDKLHTLHLPQVHPDFVQLLMRQMLSIEDESDFRLLSIDGKPCIPD